MFVESAFKATGQIVARALLALVLGALAGLTSLRAHADVLINIGGRTVTVDVPTSYDPNVATPVVMLLHGYTSSGAAQEAYMQFAPISESEGFLFLAPDGTVDCLGNPFWDATDSCCEFCGTPVDDVGYLNALLDEVELEFNVDTNRVYLVGHSNGGFMAYRMGCESAGRIAAIASFAGATFDDPLDCAPSEPVHVLQIHGTLDDTIFYPGGMIIGFPYPGAIATAETWATYSGCQLFQETSAPPLDLDVNQPGNETDVIRYETGCAPGGSAEHWRINGGGHVPALTANFARDVVDFLFAHPKAAALPVPAVGSPALLVLVLVAAVTFTARRALTIAGTRRSGRMVG